MTPQLLRETSATDHSSTATEEAGSTTKADDHDRPSSATPVALLMAGYVVTAALSIPAVSGAILPAAGTWRRRDEIYAESATSESECDPELLTEVRDLFERGASEFFQDGMHSEFSRALLLLIGQQGRPAIRAIAEYASSRSPKADVMSEALRWIAEVKDPSTLLDRWYVLQRGIKSASPKVRDGAIVGFASLDDPRARTVLEEAKRSEQIAELRRLMEQVIDQLNATANAPVVAHSPTKPMA